MVTILAVNFLSGTCFASRVHFCFGARLVGPAVNNFIFLPIFEVNNVVIIDPCLAVRVAVFRLVMPAIQNFFFVVFVIREMEIATATCARLASGIILVSKAETVLV